MPPSREPDLEFDAYMRVTGCPELLCDCRIWLPQDAREDAHVELTVPASPEPPIYLGPGPLAFRGVAGSTRDVTLSGVWLKSGPAHHSPPRLAGRSHLELFQIDDITERISFEKYPSGPPHSASLDLNFGLTDCKYLVPATWTKVDGRSGDVKVTVVGQFTVMYSPLGMIQFERHYNRYRRSDIPGTVTTSELVASIIDPGSPMIERMEITREHIEDACLLASLGARHRVTVIRVESSASDEARRTWINPLRRPRPEPQDDQFAEGLIPEEEFETFFRAAGNAFCWASEADRKRIRDAIYAVVPVYDFRGVETAFLAMFSALEGLSRFGKADAPGGLTILDETRWKVLKRAVAKAIGDFQETLSPAERDAMYQKIGELNRPTLRASVAEFLCAHAVGVDDLWPLFGSRAMPGLAELRNRLAHGDVPAGDSIAALGIARSHLRALLERCLLSILGFSISKSRVSPSSIRLQTLVEHDRIEEFQRMLASRP